jgi:hypothetical protein
MGKGSIVGQAMLDSPHVNAVSFTGSTGTGARVAEACVKRGAKFQLEMGGKNPMVVLSDADLELAVDPLLDAAGEDIDAFLELGVGVEAVALADGELRLDDGEVLGLGLPGAAEPAVDAVLEGLGDGLGGRDESGGHGRGVGEE